jgi:hypothetical protein
MSEIPRRADFFLFFCIFLLTTRKKNHTLKSQTNTHTEHTMDYTRTTAECNSSANRWANRCLGGSKYEIALRNAATLRHRISKGFYGTRVWADGDIEVLPSRETLIAQHTALVKYARDLREESASKKMFWALMEECKQINSVFSAG